MKGEFEMYPMQLAPTCDYPNCYNGMSQGIAGSYDGDPNPSQWCEEHLIYVQKKCKKDPNWITKFQKGKIKGLPEDKKTLKVYAW